MIRNRGTSAAGILRVDMGKVVDEFFLERGVNLRELRSQIILLGYVFAEVEEGELGALYPFLARAGTHRLIFNHLAVFLYRCDVGIDPVMIAIFTTVFNDAHP